MIKRFSAIIFFGFIAFAPALVVAQEVIRPLTTNPVIKEYLKKNPLTGKPAPHTASVVALPFIDDFSKPGIYADAQLWQDSGAFINSQYCDNPPTVGVATFDGIDKYGNPYDSTVSSTASAVCDYLTSLPIDMSG